MSAARKRRTAGPGHAVVTLPALDLRLEPRHAAELGSQLLLGETVRILGRSADAGWVRVRNDADGYAGWVRGWGLVEASAARVARWRARAKGVIAAPLAQIRTGRGEGAAVSPVAFGARLIVGPARAGYRAVELPDGRRGFLEASAFAGRRRPTIEERVLTLLGTPYLWGGRTPAGYDCSAFVQQVLLEQGLALPRDAKDQCRRSRPLRGSQQPRIGDLVFFRRPGESASHVGLSVGGGYYAHCRGRVQIASLDADNPLCDKDLLPQSMGWFRPL